jgi:hypothetical protein
MVRVTAQISDDGNTWSKLDHCDVSGQGDRSGHGVIGSSENTNVVSPATFDNVNTKNCRPP